MARKKKVNLKLDLDLIPQTCFFSNVRTSVSKKEWDVIRKQVYSAAWNVCQICGSTPKQSLHAHEIWEFNDAKRTQKLVGMIALCPPCHEVKHFGLANVMGRTEQALKHFMKINGMNKKDSLQHIDNQFVIWQQRSNKEWKLDISYLKNYNVDLDKIKQWPKK